MYKPNASGAYETITRPKTVNEIILVIYLIVVGNEPVRERLNWLYSASGVNLGNR
jgi:hypothetical protein